MSNSQENNPKIIHKGVVFQEHNIKVANSKKLVVGRCQYLIDEKLSRMYLDGKVPFNELLLSYNDGFSPLS